MIIRELYFQCEGVFMIVWLYILYALIAIVVIGIFLPNGIAGGLDNVPLLIVILSILLIVVLFKMIRYFRMFLIAKKHLKNSLRKSLFWQFPVVCFYFSKICRRDSIHNYLEKLSEISILSLAN